MGGRGAKGLGKQGKGTKTIRKSEDPINDNGSFTDRAVNAFIANGFKKSGDKLLISPYKLGLEKRADGTYFDGKKLSEGETRLFTSQYYGIDIKKADVYQSWGGRGTDLTDRIEKKMLDILEKEYGRKFQ